MKKILSFIIVFVTLIFMVSCDKNLEAKYISDIENVDYNYISHITNKQELSLISAEYAKFLKLDKYTDGYFSRKNLIIVGFFKDEKDQIKSVKVNEIIGTLEVIVNYEKKSDLEELKFGLIKVEIGKEFDLYRIKILTYNVTRKEYGNNYYYSNGHIIRIDSL